MVSTVLISDPHLAFLYSEVEKLLPQGVDFRITIEVERYGSDAVVPKYTLCVVDWEQQLGPVSKPEDFLEAIRTWYKNNPLEIEEDWTADDFPSRVDLLKYLDKGVKDDADQKQSDESGVYPDELGRLLDVQKEILLQEGVQLEAKDGEDFG